MRARCRIGIHEWAHLGYVPSTDSNGSAWHRVWRYCTACGERHQSRRKPHTPPDVTHYDDGTYTDHSRPKETQ